MRKLIGPAIRMGDAVWVRAGPEGYLRGKCEHLTIYTAAEWFGDHSGAIILQQKRTTKQLSFKGRWTTDSSKGFGTFQLSAPLFLFNSCRGRRRVELEQLQFYDVLCTMIVNGEKKILRPHVQKITTSWKQVFTGESIGCGENVVTMADPADFVRRGEGDLMEYKEFDAANKSIPLNTIFCSEKMQITEAKLTIHASTRSFREKTWADIFQSPGYASAAQDAGYLDDSVHVMAPSQIFEMLWPADCQHNRGAFAVDATPPPDSPDNESTGGGAFHHEPPHDGAPAWCPPVLPDEALAPAPWGAEAPSAPPFPFYEAPASAPWGAEAPPQHGYIRRADSGNAMPAAPWDLSHVTVGSPKAEPAIVEGMGLSNIAIAAGSDAPFSNLVPTALGKPSAEQKPKAAKKSLGPKAKADGQLK